MGPMSSPNDPVFFLHHCFVDKLWADWQRAHPTAGYEPVSGAPAGHNLGDAMSPWAAQGQTVTPASVLDHHGLGYAYDNEPECRPKFKFRDDIPTFKFRDDPQTLKFRDDLPTIKFRDDPQTLKFADDLQTLKFRDDGVAAKPLADIPGPDQIGPRPVERSPGTAGSAVPFVLATPHHSMAWASSFPEAFQATITELERQLNEYSTAIAERDDAQQHGLLTDAEIQQLNGLRQEFNALLAEYEAMLRRTSGSSGGRG